MQFIKYFDAWEELVELAQADPDPEEHRQRMEWVEKRRDKILSMWRTVMTQAFPQTKSFDGCK